MTKFERDPFIANYGREVDFLVGELLGRPMPIGEADYIDLENKSLEALNTSGMLADVPDQERPAVAQIAFRRATDIADDIKIFFRGSV